MLNEEEYSKHVSFGCFFKLQLHVLQSALNDLNILWFQVFVAVLIGEFPEFIATCLSVVGNVVEAHPLEYFYFVVAAVPVDPYDFGESREPWSAVIEQVIAKDRAYDKLGLASGVG